MRTDARTNSVVKDAKLPYFTSFKEQRLL